MLFMVIFGKERPRVVRIAKVKIHPSSRLGLTNTGRYGNTKVTPFKLLLHKKRISHGEKSQKSGRVIFEQRMKKVMPQWLRKT